MAPLQRAHVKEELLIWARERSGLTLEAAAGKIQVTPERLASWELGADKPTIKQLRKASRVYHFSLAVFFLPAPPDGYQPIRDYRRLPSASAAVLSPRLTLEIRSAFERRDVVRDLLAELDEESAPFTLRASRGDDPEELGQRFRDYLGVTLPAQQRWRDPGTAFREWRAAIEAKGVLVFQADRIPVEEMRGFSIGDGGIPAMVVNRADSYAGRAFSLLHELTHIALQTEGICNLSEAGAPSSERRRLEAFCNHAAGAALVPRGALIDAPALKVHPGLHWTPEELEPLSRMFGASRQVLIRRLLLLGRADQDTYERVMDQLEKEFKDLPKRESARISPPIDVLSKVGRSYARLALSAYYQRRITASTLSDYLGLRIRHFQAIERYVLT